MHRRAFTYRAFAFNGIVFDLLGALLGAGGCAGTVDAAKLAAQRRGEPLAQVQRHLGNCGDDVFEFRSNGAVYYCRSCRVGDAADLYHIIFRDGALWKVVRDPGFRHLSIGGRPVAAPEYLWGRATRLLDAPDVPAPPNRPKAPEQVRRDQDNAKEATVWLLGMSPFIVGFAPVWLIAGGIYAMSVHPIHMADVHLGDTAAAVESHLGPAGAREWRRYQRQSDGTSILTVLLKDGVVVGRFSADLLDDSSPPPAPRSRPPRSGTRRGAPLTRAFSLTSAASAKRIPSSPSPTGTRESRCRRDRAAGSPA